MTHSWLKSFGGNTRPSVADKNRFRPQLEGFEDRWVPTTVPPLAPPVASVAAATTTVTIDFNSMVNAAAGDGLLVSDTVTITIHTTTNTYTVTVAIPNRGTPNGAAANAAGQLTDRPGIQNVVVNGGTVTFNVTELWAPVGVSHESDGRGENHSPTVFYATST